MNPLPFRTIPCSAWGARPARSAIVSAGRFNRAIFHHTAGHHAEISNPQDESYEEAVRYARAVQNYHMDHNGWNDSGHNYLVARNGYIFEGRHRTVELVAKGQCPVSAHCVGQNGNPGIEHEHLGNEPMTDIQYRASVWLFAMLCRKGGFQPSQIFGHRDFNSTSCPSDVLYHDLPQFRKDVAKALAPPKPPPAPADKYTIRMVDKKGKTYTLRHQRYPGKALHEFGVVAHKIKHFEGDIE